jgi:hypothetical protein
VQSEKSERLESYSLNNKRNLRKNKCKCKILGANNIINLKVSAIIERILILSCKEKIALIACMRYKSLKYQPLWVLYT